VPGRLSLLRGAGREQKGRLRVFEGSYLGKIISFFFDFVLYNNKGRRRKMKKKYLISVLSALALVFGLLFTSCNGDNGNNNNNNNKSEKEYVFIAPTENFRDLSAADVVSGIRIGWNLGNTLDASDGETSWGNPKTTKANFDALKNAGFNAVRIPVSWSQSAKKSNNYTISDGFMTRVKEVVGYAVSNDMYIILNTHHDESIFMFLNKNMDDSKEALERVWQQIAEAFRDYDEKLIFEGLNEPRTKGSPAEWNGGTPEERKNLNTLNQLFVDTVRFSSGNNTGRVLMVPTYAASVEPDAMSALVIPNDPGNEKNKIVVSLHSYSPYDFALRDPGGTANWSADNSTDKAGITGWLDRANTLFVSKGTPVIVGEMGAVDRNNEDARAEWAEYYVSYAKKYGIPCFLWDNGNFSSDGEVFGFLNRSLNTFKYQKMLDGFMKGTE
jgi:endoglucanase